jgi:hypothetical protein
MNLKHITIDSFKSKLPDPHKRQRLDGLKTRRPFRDCKLNFKKLIFKKLNFEKLSFKKLNFEKLIFKKLNFEKLNFKKLEFNSTRLDRCRPSSTKSKNVLKRTPLLRRWSKRSCANSRPSCGKRKTR